MVHPSFRIAMVFTTLLVFATSTAQAAKGVKKNVTEEGLRTLTGVVTNVVPNKTGGGTFHLMTPHSHKKLTTNIAAGTSHPHEFQVSSTTRFEQQMGTAVNVANASALRRGSRVRVMANGQHAEKVQIFASQRSAGNLMRHRSSNYRPQLHYHRPRR